jgi:hypothetical protein
MSKSVNTSTYNNNLLNKSSTTYDSIILHQESSGSHDKEGFFSITYDIKKPHKFSEHYSSHIKIVKKNIYTLINKLQTYLSNKSITPVNNYIPTISIVRGILSKFYFTKNDIFNRNFDSIHQFSFLYLYNGLSTVMLTPIEDPYSDHKFNNVFSCDILISNYLKNSQPNIPYVLSTKPIVPYINYKYSLSYNQSNVIESGLFSILPISIKIQKPTIVISNYDYTTNTDNTPFINLLYTTIDTQNTLNILNSDYSLLCSLNILNITLSTPGQTVITYSIKSGSLLKITDTRYIFTLLNSNDIITNIENYKTYQSIFRYAHGLLLTTDKIMNDNLKINPKNRSLIDASVILANTISQSNMLINSSFILDSDIILTGIITSLYNSIIIGINSLPDNNELQKLLLLVNSFNSPLIVINLLTNILLYIEVNIPKSDLLFIVTDALQKINTILDTPNMLIPNSKLITDIVNNVTITINNEYNSNTTDPNIIVIKNMIKNHEISNKQQGIIEYYDNPSKKSNTNYTIIIVILLITFIIYLVPSNTKVKNSP